MKRSQVDQAGEERLTVCKHLGLLRLGGLDGGVALLQHLLGHSLPVAIEGVDQSRYMPHSLELKHHVRILTTYVNHQN